MKYLAYFLPLGFALIVSLLFVYLLLFFTFQTTFDNGTLKLTTHRIVWDDLDQQDRAISVTLSLVSKVEEQSAGFMSRFVTSLI